MTDISIELSSAYISVLPSTRGFTSALQSQIGGPLGHVGDQAGVTAGKSFAGKFSTVAKIGLIGAAGGLAAGLGLIFKTGWSEQSDFLKGQAQLTAGVKSTGGAANVSVKHMEDLAGSIQGMSGQTDDSVVSAEQLLLTFTSIKNTKTDKIFDQATLAAANMAAKMGGDASSNAILLGKALNDPTKGLTALTRVGVSFTAGQVKSIKAMQASGNVAGAQKIILKELGTEFGGAAKAAGDTLPGQMARAKRSFEDISQSVLAALMPAITKVSDWIVKTGIPAFAQLVSWVKTHWPPVQAVLLRVWEVYVSYIKNVALPMWAKIITAVKDVVAWVVAHWPQVQAAFVTAWKVIRPTLVAFGDLLKTVWNSVIKPLVAWVVAHWSQISAVVKVVFVAVAVAAAIVVTALKVAFRVLAAEIKVLAAVFGWLWHNIVAPVFNGIVTLIRSAKDNIAVIINAVKTIISGIGSAFSAAYTNVKTWIGDIVGFVKGLPGKLGAVVGDMVGMGKRIINGLWDGMRAIWSSITGWFSSLPSKILSVLGIHSPPDWAVEAGGHIMKGILKGIVDAAGGAAGFMSRWTKSVAKTVGGAVSIGGNISSVGIGGVSGAVLSAIKLTGVGMDWLQPILRRIVFESGGNPNAVNNSDANAKRGTPSIGLMQVIGPTFDAYAVAGHNSNIRDPVSNIAAAIQYIKAAYGTIHAIDPPVQGYAGGAWNVARDQLAYLHRSEMVVPAAAAAKFRQGGGQPVVYVQNPFTGEYLLAQVAATADGRIGAHLDQQSNALTYGYA